MRGWLLSRVGGSVMSEHPFSWHRHPLPPVVLMGLLLCAPTSRAEDERDASDVREDGTPSVDDDAEPWGSWQGPTDCIDQDELLDRVERSFAEQLVPRNRSVTGEVQPTKAGWLVRFNVTERGRDVGRRVLDLPPGNCREYDETIVLVYSLLLEHGPSPEERAEVSEQPEAKPQPNPSTQESTIHATPAPSEAAGKRPFFSSTIDYVFVRGWSKRSFGGPSAEVAFSPVGAFWIGVGGVYLPPVTASVDSASLKSWGGYLVGSLCWRSPSRLLVFYGCAQSGPMFLHARAVGVDETSRRHFETGFLGLRAELRMHVLPRFFVAFGSRGSVTWGRAELEIVVQDVPEIVYETRRLWGGFSVGAGLTY